MTTNLEQAIREIEIELERAKAVGGSAFTLGFRAGMSLCLRIMKGWRAQ